MVIFEEVRFTATETLSNTILLLLYGDVISYSHTNLLGSICIIPPVDKEVAYNTYTMYIAIGNVCHTVPSWHSIVVT